MPPKQFKKTMNKKKIFKSKKGTKTSTTVVKSSLRDHKIIDDRAKTVVSASSTANFPVVTQFEQITVYGNSLFHPFSTSNPMIGTLTATNSSTINNPPIGYTAYSTLYSQYRVRGSRIKVTVQPQLSTDSILLVVFPVPQLFSGGTAPPFETQNQRYARYKICSSSNNVKENTIIHYMNSAEVLGFTHQQYNDYPATLVTSAPTANLDWYWQIAMYTVSGVNTSNIVPVTVELALYTEFQDPINLTN